MIITIFYALLSSKKLILYEPRNKIGGSVVCHIGEAHLKRQARGKILKYLDL